MVQRELVCCVSRGARANGARFVISPRVIISVHLKTAAQPWMSTSERPREIRAAAAAPKSSAITKLRQPERPRNC